MTPVPCIGCSGKSPAVRCGCGSGLTSKRTEFAFFKRRLDSKSGLDWLVRKRSFELMKPIHPSNTLPFSHRHFLAALAIGLNTFSGANAQVLEFLQPTN